MRWRDKRRGVMNRGYDWNAARGKDVGSRRKQDISPNSSRRHVDAGHTPQAVAAQPSARRQRETGRCVDLVGVVMSLCASEQAEFCIAPSACDAFELRDQVARIDVSAVAA